MMGEVTCHQPVAHADRS